MEHIGAVIGGPRPDGKPAGAGDPPPAKPKPYQKPKRKVGFAPLPPGPRLQRMLEEARADERRKLTQKPNPEQWAAHPPACWCCGASSWQAIWAQATLRKSKCQNCGATYLAPNHTEGKH